MKLDSSIIICADEAEQTEKRNACKKRAKQAGTFVRVDHNTVVTKNYAVTFVVDDTDYDDEHLGG